MTVTITSISAREANPAQPLEDLAPGYISPDLTNVPSEPPTPSQRRALLRHLLLGLLIAAVLCGGAYAGWQYWTVWQYEVSTDDAYVQADVVAIAPQVAGKIASLFVGDNEPVKAGQILAVIDPRSYQAAVDQANAAVQQAQATIKTNQAQIAEQQSAVAEIEATLVADKAAEVYAQQNNERFGQLAKRGYGSVQNAQQAESQIASARAVIAKDQAALDAARKQITTLKARLDLAKAGLEQSKAVLEQAKINLGYTSIRAPADGVVGNRTLRIGQYVVPGTNLLAIVPLAKTYVVANYKETQLADVRPGQPVSVTVDTFPDAVVRGFVESIAPASGQEFALLPPDNATGNFTKIVQRIPVKIRIDPRDPLAGRLRPGMSVTATIDVHGKPSTVGKVP